MSEATRRLTRAWSRLVGLYLIDTSFPSSVSTQKLSSSIHTQTHSKCHLTAALTPPTTEQINVLRKHTWYVKLNLWIFYSFSCNLLCYSSRLSHAKDEQEELTLHSPPSVNPQKSFVFRPSHCAVSFKISTWCTNSIWYSREVETPKRRRPGVKYAGCKIWEAPGHFSGRQGALIFRLSQTTEKSFLCALIKQS